MYGLACPGCGTQMDPTGSWYGHASIYGCPKCGDRYVLTRRFDQYGVPHEMWIPAPEGVIAEWASPEQARVLEQLRLRYLHEEM